MKKTTKIVAAIETLCAIIVIGAIKCWAPVCQKMLQLQNGNETHMKCFFTAQASVALSVVLLTIAIVTFFAKHDHKKIQIGALVTAAMILIMFTTALIGICAKPEMACHVTAAWCRPAAIVAGICALVDIFSGSKDQLPS